jgi:hypothetical protein
MASAVIFMSLSVSDAETIAARRDKLVNRRTRSGTAAQPR